MQFLYDAESAIPSYPCTMENLIWFDEIEYLQRLNEYPCRFPSVFACIFF